MRGKPESEHSPPTRCAASSSGSGSRRAEAGPLAERLAQLSGTCPSASTARCSRAWRSASAPRAQPARSPALARMLEDFASELQKLDEGLRLLTAFLSRLREQTPGARAHAPLGSRAPRSPRCRAGRLARRGDGARDRARGPLRRAAVAARRCPRRRGLALAFARALPRARSGRARVRGRPARAGGAARGRARRECGRAARGGRRGHRRAALGSDRAALDRARRACAAPASRACACSRRSRAISSAWLPGDSLRARLRIAPLRWARNPGDGDPLRRLWRARIAVGGALPHPSLAVARAPASGSARGAAPAARADRAGARQRRCRRGPAARARARRCRSARARAARGVPPARPRARALGLGAASGLGQRRDLRAVPRRAAALGLARGALPTRAASRSRPRRAAALGYAALAGWAVPVRRSLLVVLAAGLAVAAPSPAARGRVALRPRRSGARRGAGRAVRARRAALVRGGGGIRLGAAPPGGAPSGASPRRCARAPPRSPPRRRSSRGTAAASQRGGSPRTALALPWLGFARAARGAGRRGRRGGRAAGRGAR